MSCRFYQSRSGKILSIAKQSGSTRTLARSSTGLRAQTMWFCAPTSRFAKTSTRFCKTLKSSKKCAKNFKIEQKKPKMVKYIANNYLMTFFFLEIEIFSKTFFGKSRRWRDSKSSRKAQCAKVELYHRAYARKALNFRRDQIGK